MKQGDQRRKGEGVYSLNSHDDQREYMYGVLVQNCPRKQGEHVKPYPKPMGRQQVKEWAAFT